GFLSYVVDGDGRVSNDVPEALMKVAREARVRVYAVAVNPHFEQAPLIALLASDEAQGRAVAAMIDIAQRRGFRGWQLDFENVTIGDGERYTRFFVRAARELHAAGLEISAGVVPRLSDEPGPTPYHDWMRAN